MSDDRPAQSGQTAAAYIEKKWGGATRTTPLTAVVVGAGLTVRALQRNPRRMQYTILNPGSGNAFWGQTANDAGLSAVLISPLGGSIELLIDEDGEGVTDEAYIFAPGSVTVYVQEVFRK
jgi:hypothetical protein